MMVTVSHAIALAILRERTRQNLKWGEQNHNDEIWALILGEEFGELQKAILEDIFTNPGDRPVTEEVRTELVQVVSVGIQWLEALERREGKESTPEAIQRRRDADALFNVGPDA